MIARAWIISYLPDEQKLREKRLQHHKQQLDWLEDLYSRGYIEGINVFEMNYTDEEKEDHLNQYESLNFVNFDNEKLMPGFARNRLLDQFYNSLDSFGLFMDNDCMIKPDSIMGDDIIYYFRQKWDEMDGLDLISIIYPYMEPYTKNYQENKEFRDNNLYFRRATGFKGSLFFIRNIKKDYDKEIYFEWGESEELDFSMEFIYNGLGSHKCYNAVLREMGQSYSSLYTAETEEQQREIRKETGQSHNDRQVEKWGECGLYKSEKGHLKRQRFLKRYFNRPVEVSIPLNGNPLEDLFA